MPFYPPTVTPSEIVPPLAYTQIVGGPTAAGDQLIITSTGNPSGPLTRKNMAYASFGNTIPVRQEVSKNFQVNSPSNDLECANRVFVDSSTFAKPAIVALTSASSIADIVAALQVPSW